MVSLAGKLPRTDLAQTTGYRLINSKFPPIALFDDVADAEEFELLYKLQSLTNPRLQTEAGELNLVAPEHIPFGIPGCSFAVAPFTHINPNGSRFSDGLFGVLYIADRMETALAEVRYHQERYWGSVEGLNYERFVFRGLACRFRADEVCDATTLPLTHSIYHPNDYSDSRALGIALRTQGTAAVQYHSVRAEEAMCWGLFTPRPVQSIVQSAHFEFVWDGQAISSINKLVALTHATAP